MPIVRVGTDLVYYAHVPKCAGSAVENYLADRFGRLAFLDRQHLAQPEGRRWTRTSPQHADWASFARIVPPDFLAAAFAVVRHPLSRAVSAYRFQAEVEETVPEGMGFGDWLAAEAAARRDDPHRSDNHSRPQVDFLPPGDALPCRLFHLEHGLDALIPWLDALAGDRGGPRTVLRANEAGERRRREIGPVAPTAAEAALVAEIFAEDFARLGYAPERPAPLAPPPALDAAFLAEAAAARARAGRPLHRLAMRARRAIRRRWTG